jgi:hypothetical protein
MAELLDTWERLLIYSLIFPVALSSEAGPGWFFLLGSSLATIPR